MLVRASYDEATVKALVRADGLDFGLGLSTLRLRPSGNEALGRLVRLFLAGDRLEEAHARAALEPVEIADLEAAGLVESTPDGVRALVRLNPVRGTIVASDPRSPGRRLPPDHVIAPGPASETLAALTVRAPVATALDLCCGSGVQALLAAEHADRVVGTDLNPRALHLAVLSAALSGADNVEWRLGDLFEPVDDELFDLVVSNPPFVISPATELTFRDGARGGDELSSEILTGVAARLLEGGFGHVLCSWVRGSGEHWSETPARWLEGHGCDAVILHLDSESPATYAVRWTSIDAASPAEAVDRAESWLEYYAMLGIEEIATGLVVLRRRSGANWVHADELTAASVEAGAHLARVFAGHDTLAGLDDERALLELRLTFAPAVRLVERWDPSTKLARARLTIAGGVQLPGPITPPSAAPVLRALDGCRTLAEAATAADVPSSELDAALASLRDLVRRGYLVVGRAAG